MLTADTAIDYLRRRGVLASVTGAQARMLAGGVSNVVVLVEADNQRVVVKQALERLRVADDWRATPTRAHTEATALGLLGEITPAAVPRLLDDDPASFALTISAAPADWTTWKQQLLAGRCDPAVAGWLGETLRRWHEATAGADLPDALEDRAAFAQLRIDPYFRVSAQRRPELADDLAAVIDAIGARRMCLVSGDFSPKNVLVGPGGRWVIDLEVAHRGDPAFDVAFLLSHLYLKARHLPANRAALRTCVEAFRQSYGSASLDARHLHAVLGALLLARVVGSSPVEYLAEHERAAVESAAATLLWQRPESLDEVWEIGVEQ